MLWAVFQFRQKALPRGLSTLYPKEFGRDMAEELLKAARINPTYTSLRLTMENWAELCYHYTRQCEE